MQIYVVTSLLFVSCLGQLPHKSADRDHGSHFSFSRSKNFAGRPNQGSLEFDAEHGRIASGGSPFVEQNALRGVPGPHHEGFIPAGSRNFRELKNFGAGVAHEGSQIGLAKELGEKPSHGDGKHRAGSKDFRTAVAHVSQTFGGSPKELNEIPFRERSSIGAIKNHGATIPQAIPEEIGLGTSHGLSHGMGSKPVHRGSAFDDGLRHRGPFPKESVNAFVANGFHEGSHPVDGFNNFEVSQHGNNGFQQNRQSAFTGGPIHGDPKFEGTPIKNQFSSTEKFDEFGRGQHGGPKNLHGSATHTGSNNFGDQSLAHRGPHFGEHRFGSASPSVSQTGLKETPVHGGSPFLGNGRFGGVLDHGGQQFGGHGGSQFADHGGTQFGGHTGSRGAPIHRGSQFGDAAGIGGAPIHGGFQFGGHTEFRGTPVQDGSQFHGHASLDGTLDHGGSQLNGHNRFAGVPFHGGSQFGGHTGFGGTSDHGGSSFSGLNTFTGVPLHRGSPFAEEAELGKASAHGGQAFGSGSVDQNKGVFASGGPQFGGLGLVGASAHSGSTFGNENLGFNRGEPFQSGSFPVDKFDGLAGGLHGNVEGGLHGNVAGGLHGNVAGGLHGNVADGHSALRNPGKNVPHRAVKGFDYPVRHRGSTFGGQHGFEGELVHRGSAFGNKPEPTGILLNEGFNGFKDKDHVGHGGFGEGHNQIGPIDFGNQRLHGEFKNSERGIKSNELNNLQLGLSKVGPSFNRLTEFGRGPIHNRQSFNRGLAHSVLSLNGEVGHGGPKDFSLGFANNGPSLGGLGGLNTGPGNFGYLYNAESLKDSRVNGPGIVGGLFNNGQLPNGFKESRNPSEHGGILHGGKPGFGAEVVHIGSFDTVGLGRGGSKGLGAKLTKHGSSFGMEFGIGSDEFEDRLTHSGSSLTGTIKGERDTRNPKGSRVRGNPLDGKKILPENLIKGSGDLSIGSMRFKHATTNNANKSFKENPIPSLISQEPAKSGPLYISHREYPNVTQKGLEVQTIPKESKVLKEGQLVGKPTAQNNKKSRGNG